MYSLTPEGGAVYVTKLDSNGNFGGWATRLSSSSSGSVTWDSLSSSLFVTGSFSGTQKACTADACSGAILTSNSPQGGGQYVADVFVAKLDVSTGLPPVTASALLAAGQAAADVPDALSLSQASLDGVVSQAIGYWPLAHHSGTMRDLLVGSDMIAVRGGLSKSTKLSSLIGSGTTDDGDMARQRDSGLTTQEFMQLTSADVLIESKRFKSLFVGNSCITTGEEMWTANSTLIKR